MAEGPYNPLDKINLGKSVAEALLDKESVPLGTVPQFDGAGIYAIYYRGNFPAYKPITERNAERDDWPIYVGKAIPSGGRKGIGALYPTVGRFLWNRLREHADSIRAVSNLEIADFTCRYLAVDDIWIPLGETLLISKFSPLWNVVVDGFGNHDPGKGRYSGLRPLWDVLHPGRPWAEKCQRRPETVKEIENRIAISFIEIEI